MERPAWVLLYRHHEEILWKGLNSQTRPKSLYRAGVITKNGLLYEPPPNQRIKLVMIFPNRVNNNSI